MMTKATHMPSHYSRFLFTAVGIALLCSGCAFVKHSAHEYTPLQGIEFEGLTFDIQIFAADIEIMPFPFEWIPVLTWDPIPIKAVPILPFLWSAKGGVRNRIYIVLINSAEKVRRYKMHSSFAKNGDSERMELSIVPFAFGVYRSEGEWVSFESPKEGAPWDNSVSIVYHALNDDAFSEESSVDFRGLGDEFALVLDIELELWGGDVVRKELEFPVRASMDRAWNFEAF